MAVKQISIANPVFCGNEKKYLNECIDTGWISANGKFIPAFEAAFAEFCGTKYALACANGTVTLHLILQALGIGPGDEVIMPALTYIATANVARYCGATPVFADCQSDTWNLDPQSVEACITPRTKAIIPVHLYGLSCDMTALGHIANTHGIPIIEDAAEAHGATWNGKRVGSLGLAGSFSFFGNKIITCGEGGMITTDDEQLYEKMKLLRSQGVSPEKRYWHVEVGYNYRMTNMQAAVGLGQLEQIEWHLAQRKRVQQLYMKHLEQLKECVTFQSSPPEAVHVYWMFSVLLCERVHLTRDAVMEEMEKHGIEGRPLFYPVHHMPPYFDPNVSAPVAEHLASCGLNLPSHAMLTEEDIIYICNTLKKILMQ